jgi:hypothetical protein
LAFPASPTNGQSITASNGITYVYSTSTNAWSRVSTGSSSFTGGIITNPTTISSTTASSSTSTGALTVVGGVGIGGALYAGNIYTNGQLVSAIGPQGTTGTQGATGTQGTQGTTGPSSINAINDQQNTGTGYISIPKGTTDQRPGVPDYGAMRYNTTTGFAEVYTVNGWGTFGAAPPTISTVSPATYNGESGTSFTINGANFTSDAVVKFVDVNNTEFSAAVVTFVNSSQLLATTPQDFTVAQEPLDVRVIQLSGTVTKLDCIDTGGSPSWTTAAGQIGGTIYKNGSVSTSVAATDPDTSATIAYSVYSGALPSGLSLNTSTGAITGTAPNIGSDTTYNFTLRVTDNAGNTADRAFSMIILQGAPGAPTIGSATRSASQSVQVAFTAPANTGGSSITSYTATSSPGEFTGTGATSPVTVSGLTNGIAYTFTVTATNSYGTGVASSASNSATPYTVPGAPTIGSATATGTTTATVAFTAPASNGGTPITSYTAVSSPGGITGTLSQAGSGTITVSGLTAGTSYTFTVYATNAAGNSSNSTGSNQITTPQPAPTSVEYLVLAGGGGGRDSGYSIGSAGGGGAGGYYNSTIGVSASTAYTVTVGGGGPNNGSGSPSEFSSIYAYGGGTGGTGSRPNGENGTAGGSGGGGGYGDSNGGSGGGSLGGGNSGGTGGVGPPHGAAGGGGAGGAGGSGHGGAGGSGATSSITGSSVIYACGGGGGNEQAVPGNGGSSNVNGGRGGSTSQGYTPQTGAAYTGTGGGGGGGQQSQSGVGGGSGVVIIAYPNTFKTPTISGGLSYDQPSRSGYRVYRFTGGTGNISW